MKKHILLTTALVSSLAFAAPAHAGGAAYRSEPVSAKPTPVATSYSSASGLGVSVGGFIDFQAGFADQDGSAGAITAANPNNANSRDVKFQNDTEIHVKVEGHADNGLVYGAVIELNADISRDGDNDGANADKTYIYLESMAGRVELGGNSGAEQTLKVDAGTIARGTGGIAGDWYDFVNTGTQYFNPITGRANNPTVKLYNLHGDLPLADAKGISEDATKITYYTPRFAGFQLGVSYTPDSGNAGTAAGFTSDNNAGQFEDIFHVGGNYEGNFQGVGVQAGVTGTFGQSEANGYEDLAAWNAGAAVSFRGFSVAGSYGDWNDSGKLSSAQFGDDDYWTAGAAYETGPFGVSVTYLDSSFADNDLTNLVVGADYQLAPGLVPYVEVSFFDLDPALAGAPGNDGSVVLVGYPAELLVQDLPAMGIHKSPARAIRRGFLLGWTGGPAPHKPSSSPELRQRLWGDPAPYQKLSWLCNPGNDKAVRHCKHSETIQPEDAVRLDCRASGS